MDNSFKIQYFTFAVCARRATSHPSYLRELHLSPIFESETTKLWTDSFHQRLVHCLCQAATSFSSHPSDYCPHLTGYCHQFKVRLFASLQYSSLIHQTQYLRFSFPSVQLPHKHMNDIVSLPSVPFQYSIAFPVNCNCFFATRRSEVNAQLDASCRQPFQNCCNTEPVDYLYCTLSDIVYGRFRRNQETALQALS